MIEYNNKNIKSWSIMGERPTFGLSLYECAKQNENIITVVADIVNSAGLEKMRTELPNQLINVGIAEQNMMGVAVGLASEGFTVFTSTFAPFQTFRCLDQIRVNLGYMQEKVIMCGLASGVAYGELGFTHCSIEDASIINSIPNIAVVTPADCTEVAKIVEASIDYDKSIYIRLLDKTKVPIVYDKDYDFQIGKAVQIFDKGEITILANGTMVSRAKNAVLKIKQEKNIDISLYDFHTLKPLDENLLLSLIDNTKAILTIEEHSIIGGLGANVASFYSDKTNKLPVYKMAMHDCYGHAASHETMLNDLNLTENAIYDKILNILEELK